MALKGSSRSLLRQCCSASAQRTFHSAYFTRLTVRWQADPLVSLPARLFGRIPARAFTSSAALDATTDDPPTTKDYLASPTFSTSKPQLVDVKKVLVIGSGGLSIGQAGEFDYSGEHTTSYKIVSTFVQYP